MLATLTGVARQPITVDDAHDPRLADYVQLNDAALRRRVEHERRVFIVEGLLAIEALLASDYEVRSVLVDERAHRRLADALAPVEAPVYVVDDDVLRATVGFDLHRGAVASAVRPPDDLVTVDRFAGDTGARRLLVLEGINDHENLGAIFRNAAAFGVDAVLLDPTCADPLYRRAVRVSMGHALLVPYARAESWPGDLKLMQDNGFHLIAMTPGQGSVPLADALAPLAEQKVGVLVGAEGPGLTEHTMRACEVRARIPMSRGTDSLNVATAAAMAFYERTRSAV